MATCANSSELIIDSYNCRGFNDVKKHYIRTVLSRCDILFIQEHWLAEPQMSILGDINSDYLYTSVSGFDNSDVLSGRPYGGCAILWRANLFATVTPIITNSKRLCAVTLCAEKWKILVINCYLPYEDDECKADEFAEQLSIIEYIINQNSDCHVIVGGDFNVDFTRNWLHTTLLRSFCDNLNLNLGIHHESCNIDFTYNFNMIRFSTIDHFLLSGTLFDTSLTSLNVIHDVDNTSDHDPITMKLSLNVAFIGGTNIVHSPRVSWVKANEDHIKNYQSVLADSLKNIVLPVDVLLCCNLKCRDIKHCSALNEYVNCLTRECLNAADATIPRTKCNKTDHCIPGWTDEVKPLKDKSLLWHKIWIECNRPREGVVADCMRRSRAAYHYAIRSVKKNENIITCERMANALLDSKTRDFWTEVKKIRNSKVCSSNTVDGCADPKIISQLFADKYRELYTCVGYNVDDMRSIVQAVDEQFDNIAYSSDCIINVNEVLKAISNLKPHKSDGNAGLTSNHIIHAGSNILCHLAFLFSALLIHGAAPDDFVHSTIVPIPKGRNANLSDSVNYRGISLSSIFCKLLDNIILQRCCSKFLTSELQFGFKAKCSTNMCSLVLKETLLYYSNNESSVYCTFLDATKAFDRVHYCKLFSLLIKRGLPPYIVRLLINMYTGHNVRVCWHGVMSNYFVAANGVKQGGVLSPVLFCIYIDNLLYSLKQAGIGCFIGSNFVGSLAYADDLVLLAPSPSALRKMLLICDAYALEYNILFNASKSKCIVVLPPSRRYLTTIVKTCTFYVGGCEIEIVDSWLHLGNTFNCRLDDADEINNKRNSLVGHINALLCYFGKLDPVVKNNLLKAYCSSMYGCEIWHLEHEMIKQYCIAWRKGQRRIWGLPNNTHNELLPIVCTSLPVFDEICKRFLGFIYKCMSHESELIRFVVRHGILFARTRSVIGLNLIFCSRRYSFRIDDFIDGNISNTTVVNYCIKSVSDNTVNTGLFLLEAVALRNGVFSLSDNVTVNRDDINDIIVHLATS